MQIKTEALLDLKIIFNDLYYIRKLLKLCKLISKRREAARQRGLLALLIYKIKIVCLVPEDHWSFIISFILKIRKAESWETREVNVL